jgi:hypothetical protein
MKWTAGDLIVVLGKAELGGRLSTREDRERSNSGPGQERSPAYSRNSLVSVISPTPVLTEPARLVSLTFAGAPQRKRAAV